MCKENKKRIKKGDDLMAKMTLEHPSLRKPKILDALKEVELIKVGKLPRKSAREFLKESRKK